MASEKERLEIGHVLFLDIVGYSKLLLKQQSELLRELNEIVSGTKEFHEAESAGKLLRLPTGDGMALVFRTHTEAPVECAMEIARELTSHPAIQLRMGIHSGPVNEIVDVNQRANIAGAGINMAQRVMDCGDAGHILLSRHVAEDLEQDERWRALLHDLGTCEVKHGVRVGVTNLYSDEVGNSRLPKKLRAARLRKRVRWAGVAGALLLLSVLAVTFLIFVQKPAPFAAEKSIAVLPFENLSEDKANAYFADGIQDELLADLSKIRDLKVISRTSVMQYKSGITRNLKEIAQQLGVTTIVEGSVRRSGDHVRVTIQLLDGLNDRHLWAESYDRTLADALTLEGELATEIAAGVGAILSPEEKARVQAVSTNNTAAYDAYLKGRTLLGLVDQNARAEGAIQAFGDAVKLDPTFALAWANLSIVQYSAGWARLDPIQAHFAAGKEALDRAVALAPNLPETHLAVGYYQYYGRRDFTGALAEFERTEQALPNNADVLEAIGLIHRRLGHWDEAIKYLRRAVELDPRNNGSSSRMMTLCQATRRFSEVIAAADHILLWDPSNLEAIDKKLLAYWAMGNLNAATALLAKPGMDPLDRAVNALFCHRYAEAADVLGKGLKTGPDDYAFLNFRAGLAQQRAGDVAGARATFERMRGYIQRQLESDPANPQAEDYSTAGLADAVLGNASVAVAEGQRAIALLPASDDPFEGPRYEEYMAQIYALLGDADHAIPILQHLLRTSYAGSLFGDAITPSLLRIDPLWDPIRSDARFQNLLE